MAAKTPEIDIQDLTGKNKIINGNMAIDQRKAGGIYTATNITYTLDRWANNKVNTAVTTMQRITSTVPSGFSNALKFEVTTAQPSIGASDVSTIYQPIEGYNCIDLNFGKASARGVTISFWVRSSKTGINCISLKNSVVNRSYVAEYTVNTSNTWEYKTIIVRGDISGTWVVDNGVGLYLLFSLASGSTGNTTAGTWQSGNFNATSNQINNLDTIGNTFHITGVQLEIGATATPFEYKTIDRQIQECQRYYEKSFDLETAPANGPNGTSFATNTGLARIGIVPWASGGWGSEILFKVRKRALGSITVYGNSSGFWSYSVIGTFVGSATDTFNGSNGPIQAYENSMFIANNVSNSALVGTKGHWAVDAEL